MLQKRYVVGVLRRLNSRTRVRQVSSDRLLPWRMLNVAAAILPRHLNPLRRFLRSLGEHSFVVSPEGNGVQCHRTWEALHSGAVAIVTQTGTAVDSLYGGLPVVILQNWKQLEGQHDDTTSPAENAARLLLGVALK